MTKFRLRLLRYLPLLLVAFLGSSCSRQAAKERVLARADEFHAAGAWDKAEVEYRNTLKADPENHRAIAQLGLIYVEQGRVGSAAFYLRKARQLDPENLEVRAKLAVLYLAVKKPEEAREEARYILEHQPDHADAPLLLAESVRQPQDIAEIEGYLKQLSPTRSAPVLTALASLEFRQRKLAECEALLKQALALEPESPSVHISLGTLYQAQNNLKSAETAFALAWKNAPLRSARKLGYVRFKLQTGDLAGARRLLVELSTQAPDLLPPLVLLSEIAASEKKYDEALATNGRILSREPYHFPAMMLNARLWLTKGEIDKALLELEKLKKLQPENHEIAYQFGLTYIAQGDLVNAVTSLNRALTLAPDYVEATLLLTDLHLKKGDAKAASTTIKPLVAKRPDFMPAKFLLARALVGQGELGEALPLFKEISAASPKDANLLLPIALIYRQQKKPDEARKILNHVLELTPDAIPAIEQLVDMDLMSGDFPAARQRVDALKRKLPDHAGAHLLSAKISLMEKKLTEAEAELLKVIELQPETYAAYYLLAGIFGQTDRDKNAVEQLELAALKGPANAPLQMRIALLHERLKNHAAARDAYEKVLALQPGFIPALNNLAYLLAEKLNALDRGETLAQKARDLAPLDPNIADTLGWILFKKGQFQRSRTLLLESAAKLANEAVVQYHLGSAHYMMGETEPARSALQRALELDPELPEKNAVKGRLELLGLDDALPAPARRAKLEKALAENKNDPFVLTRLGGVLEKSGEYDQAQQHLQAALKINPNMVSAALTMVRIHLARQQTSQALDLARATRKLAPDDPLLGHQLGNLAFQSRDFQWAASLLQESARRLPENPGVNFDWAKAAYSVGRVTEAEEVMRRIQKNQPLFANATELALYLEMISLANLPAPDGQAKIAKTLQTDPTLVPALMALGANEEKKSAVSAAQQAYEKALVQYPDFSPAKRNLALLAATSEDSNTKTYDLAVQARAAYPNDPQLAQALGILTYRKGDFSRAASLMKESIAKLGDDARRTYYLGMAQYRLKDSAARASLQRSLELGLKDEAAVNARKALAELK